MGHGIREEVEKECITFVTTGYLVRFISHFPDAFDAYTHIVIDEVHERSIDGDLLCLFTRRLLERNKSIRLILMSATITGELFKEYFKKVGGPAWGDYECLSVGTRRFPAEIHYIDTAVNKNERGRISVAVEKIKNMCRRSCTGQKNGPGAGVVPMDIAKEQYLVVAHIVRTRVALGTGVLVFVSGIADLTELGERLGEIPRCRCVFVHSEIPMEDQELAFEPAAADEIKVIVATNAAESSITLPDVDTVICLGTHKMIDFNIATRRVSLANCWVSKSSAIQRAGRTGRGTHRAPLLASAQSPAHSAAGCGVPIVHVGVV